MRNYSKEENIWKLILAIQYLQKLIITYYKNNSKKLIEFFFVTMALLLTRLTIISIAINQKYGWFAIIFNKYTKVQIFFLFILQNFWIFSSSNL